MAEVTELGHTGETAPGEKSQYDVFVDDRLVFSKQGAGRWPDSAEIIAQLP